MRCAHIFPLFGKELINGSEYYELMLSSHLTKLGMEVDIYATTSNSIQIKSAFCIAWKGHYRSGLEKIDNLNVYRYPTWTCPEKLVAVFSKLIVDRLNKEGVLSTKKSHKLYYEKALERPKIYDLLARVGRGPYSRDLLKALKANINKYDIVLTGFLPFSLSHQVITIAKKARKKVVLLPLFHPDDLYHHWNYLYRYFEKSDAVLTLTDHSQKIIRDLFSEKVKNVKTVGAGVDLKSFLDKGISGSRFRAKYGLESKKIVLFVGRKEKFKGYETAIQAIKNIKNPDIKLVMIGSDADKKPINDDFVLYLNKLDRNELIDGYDSCDLFILPSEHESFGMVFLEAWARKKPVIGNGNCGPVTSLIDDGVNGLLCKNVDEFSQAIVKLLLNRDTAKKFGENGFEKVNMEYTWDVVARKTADIYNGLLSE